MKKIERGEPNTPGYDDQGLPLQPVSLYANDSCTTCWGKGYLVQTKDPKQAATLNMCGCARKAYLKLRNEWQREAKSGKTVQHFPGAQLKTIGRNTRVG